MNIIAVVAGVRVRVQIINQKKMPYGKPLSCSLLRSALENLFDKYAGKAEELSNVGSTQLNENFNQMVSSKAPKRL